jgi:ribonuclease P protein component
VWRGPALSGVEGALARVSARCTTNLEETTIVSAAAPKGDLNAIVDPRGQKRCFPRTARLLRHADFERVYKQGRRHFSTSMTVFYLSRQAQTSENKLPSVSGLRVGFTVGRALGGAVRRTRMKRLLREAVRLSRPTPGVDADVVINPKKALLTTDFETLRNEVARAFGVIEKKLAPEPGGTAGR